MAGLDDACVDRPHGDFRDTFALHLQEPILAWHPGDFAGVIGHGVNVIRPVVVKNEWTKIGMPKNVDSYWSCSSRSNRFRRFGSRRPNSVTRRAREPSSRPVRPGVKHSILKSPDATAEH